MNYEETIAMMRPAYDEMMKAADKTANHVDQLGHDDRMTKIAEHEEEVKAHRFMGMCEAAGFVYGMKWIDIYHDVADIRNLYEEKGD